MPGWELLLDIVLLLGSSLVFGGLLARIGQSPLVGYLLAGLLLGGPGSLHAVTSIHEMEVIAELGVSLLLFSLGLEFSWQQLKSLGLRLLLSGALQVVVTLVVTFAVASLVGIAPASALALGAAVSLSSTACVLRILTERQALDAPYGRNSLSILLIQDMAVLPLALLVALMGESGESGSALFHIAQVLGLTACLILGLHVVVNVIAVRALGMLTLVQNRELAVLLAVVAGLGSAWSAHLIGISPALGSFIAGMFLGASPFSTLIRADISSLRVILLTLFFSSAGMMGNAVWIFENAGLVLGVCLLLVVLKTVLTTSILFLLKQPLVTAAASGLALAQIGEFAFVLATLGRNVGVFSNEMMSLITSTTLVTLIFSPWLVAKGPIFGRAMARLFRCYGEEISVQDAHQLPDVVVIGFGPAGQRAAESLSGCGKRVLVLDLNQALVRDAAARGFLSLLGDATQCEVLDHVHLSAAQIVILAIPDTLAAARAVQHIRRLAPQAYIIARLRYRMRRHELEAAGAHEVIDEEAQMGETLAERARLKLENC